MSIASALTWGISELRERTDTARLDAEVLLSYVLRRPVTFLLSHDEATLGFLAGWRYRRLIRKRKEGIPVAYLTGKKEFYFLEFRVTPDVLIPRPNTELLVEQAAYYLTARPDILLLDIGTGSGCIPISLLKHLPRLQAVATDLSGAALRVAARNAKRHGVASRVRFFKSDLLADLPSGLFGGRNVAVTANLPYVPLNYPVTPGVAFEPPASVYGGKDGADLIRRFTRELKGLRPEAAFLECLAPHVALIQEALQDYRLTVSGHDDCACEVRFVRLEKD